MQNAKVSCPFAGSTHLIKRLLQIVYENNTAFHYSGAASFYFLRTTLCCTELALFDTTSRAKAATDGPRWRASRESHPSEDLSELPPQSGFSLGRSIITRLPMRVGQVRNQPQCETARHRLLFGRMGTAQHLDWPSLMQILSAQVVLAHPPVSLQPPFRGGFSSADVSRCRIFSFQRLMKCHHS